MSRSSDEGSTSQKSTSKGETVNFTVDQVREVLPLLVNRGISVNVLQNPIEPHTCTTFRIQITDFRDYRSLEEVCNVVGLSTSYVPAQGWQLHPAATSVLSSSPAYGDPATGARLRRPDPPQGDQERLQRRDYR